MAAVAAFCIFAGLWPFAVLVAVIGALMAYEHATIVFGERRVWQMGLEGTALVLAPLSIAANHPILGLSAVCAVALISTLTAKSSGTSKRWGGGAVIYIGVALMAIVWLRGQPNGLAITLWLCVTIWATDSFAQIIGKSVGGAKLAPVTSPNKTWSGLFGGMLGAAIVGFLAGTILGSSTAVIAGLAALGALVAIIGQLGDLLESAFKRHFDVKDSSNLIPGHGGVLDRVDGLASAAILTALAMFFLGTALFDAPRFG